MRTAGAARPPSAIGSAARGAAGAGRSRRRWGRCSRNRSGSSGRSFGRFRFSSGGRGSRGAGAFGDGAEHFADRHHIAGLLLDLAENAIFRGSDFEIHLIGFELDQDVATVDRFSFALHPRADDSIDQ
ncbi:MAG: hypothetical protein R2845_05315 [Thermomicrobiales bacterium]